MDGLLLLGGKSRRMGRAKAWMNWEHAPLYRHGIDVLSQVCRTVHISVRTGQSARLRDALRDDEDLRIIVDREHYKECGPAAGLLSAHERHPGRTFLVMAVDLPLATKEACEQLIESYLQPVTCFIDQAGQPYPFFSIWSPCALQRLKRNVQEKKAVSLTFAIRRAIAESTGLDEDGLQAGAGIPHYVVPHDPEWLFDTNLPEEWERALGRSAG